ncbi:FMN-dependent NADH-azoreductase [Paenibacillus spongiae]|uniref:FMN dependent NADH:quinone oxidoreductase n=1 Tax=Paenibacillus spongiae TaxID=2909671 RepID=A0ABY5S4W7_9BACL|nr:FMN-dependent NADH-azoreductase [Paenibacillus spongiae]UVI28944.1 FMN-dependent NADH-azoreductase [Paenibacillus spongiae]
MSTVLFIKANNRPIEQSVSVQLYDAFYRTYTEAHPQDAVIEVDLFNERLPYFDAQMLNGIFKSAQGMELSPQESELLGIADKHLDRFLSADKIVFAFPLWNLTVPAVLHTYIDYLSRAGKTFRYTPQGPVGLAGDKKVALLCARGGDYSQEPAASAEMAVNYVAKNLRLYGVTDITTVVIEGHNQYPDKRESLIEEGLQKAVQAAAIF